MKAALYVRVSTTEQAEEGFSVAAQIHELQEYCKKNNIEIHAVYADEGISGQKENRPQFQKMIADAEKKLFNIILVHKYDRFARKVELSQRIKNQLKKSNVNVISISEPIEDSPMGFFVSGLHDLLAEYYVKNLAQESKKGHIERARQGLHNGSVPYGYKIDRSTGQMIINEEQSKVVRWIFDMYNKEGYGTTKIAMILNEHGIKTAVDGRWAHFTVNRIINNHKYIGKIYYDGEIYDGQHNAIIAENDFYKAQSNKKDRTWERSYRGANYSKYLLAGMLRCGQCKKVMSIHSAKKSSTQKRVYSWYYYKCNNAHHMDARYKCLHVKCYSVIKLEEHITSELKKIAKGTKLPAGDIIERNPVNDMLFTQKNKLQAELDRAKNAYMAEIFTLEEYGAEKKRIEDQLKQIDLTITESKKANIAKQLKSKINSLWNKFESVESIPEKKAILQEFIEVIYISPESIDIKYSL
jgi:site-specific DNA recombinase